MPFHFNFRISKGSILRSVAVLLPTCLILLYLGGLASQLFTNLHEWQQAGGYFNTEVKMQGLNFNPIVVFGQYSFTGEGLRFVGLILFLLFCISAYHYLGIRNKGGKMDERGFMISKSGTYGTARFMDRDELLGVLALQSPETADGIILGEYQRKLAVIPQDTYLNRHMMIFGSSGSGKSSTVIRNLIFSAIRNGQSVVVTDPKNELYRDTAVLFAQQGYKVRVFNLSDMQHSDSWNPMAELNRDAQRINTFVNVIFSNTENTGRGTDSYWANGEKALLSMLVKYLEYRDGTTDR